MSLDIRGWVEATRFEEPERSDEHAWQGVLNIGALVDVADSISEQLFGFSKSAVSGNRQIIPLAVSRGLPPNPSDEIRREIGHIRNIEQRFGKGEFGGYTYATWREIKSAQLDESEVSSSDWHLLFELIHRLEQDVRFSPDKIRLVIYYCW